MYTIFVSGRIAAATFSAFDESTQVEATPNREYSFSRTRREGP